MREMKDKLLNSENIKGLLLYRWYLQSDPLLLNTAKYREAFPHNTAVSYLCDLQDVAYRNPDGNE